MRDSGLRDSAFPLRSWDAKIILRGRKPWVGSLHCFETKIRTQFLWVGFYLHGTNMIFGEVAYTLYYWNSNLTWIWWRSRSRVAYWLQGIPETSYANPSISKPCSHVHLTLISLVDWDVQSYSFWRLISSSPSFLKIFCNVLEFNVLEFNSRVSRPLFSNFLQCARI